METNVVTSSENPSIPTTVATIGESSPNLPSSVRATMVSAATMSHSGPNPSMAGAHIAGPWNSGQGSVPSSGMSLWGNSFHSQWNPG
jgi:hypothetical protein